MQAKVGTTDLHISLPMYDAAVDISFDETSASETKTSDEVAILASRLAASKATGAFTLPVISFDFFTWGMKSNGIMVTHSQ